MKLRNIAKLAGGAVTTAGLVGTALHVSTLTTTVVASKPLAGGAIAMTLSVVKASLFTKVVVGVVGVGASVALGHYVYNKVNDKEAMQSLRTRFSSKIIK